MPPQATHSPSVTGLSDLLLIISLCVCVCCMYAHVHVEARGCLFSVITSPFSVLRQCLPLSLLFTNWLYHLAMHPKGSSHFLIPSSSFTCSGLVSAGNSKSVLGAYLASFYLSHLPGPLALQYVNEARPSFRLFVNFM